jgi:ATP-binding cassette, subfamily B, bacterial
MSLVATATWRERELVPALCALAHEAGLAPRGAIAPGPLDLLEPGALARSDANLERRLAAVLAPFGLQAQPVSGAYRELDRVLGGAAPAIVAIVVDGEPRLLALLRSRGRFVELLGSDLRVHRVAADALVALLGEAAAASVAPAVDELLGMARPSPARRAAVRRALIDQHLSAPLGGVWLLRTQGGTGLLAQLRRAGLVRDLVAMLLLHALAYVLLLGSFTLVGQGALGGHFETGWLSAWALVLLSIVPCELLVTWLGGRIAVGAGLLLKRRLLDGALRLEPDEVRHEGVGRLLGKVMEGEAVESLLLGGGLIALLSLVELCIAAWVLAKGGGGPLHAALLLAWLVVTLLVSFRAYRRRRDWSAQRVALTEQLVERMVGHRTRLAQLPRERVHEGEDEALDRYIALSEQMDRKQRDLLLLPRGFMLLGLLSLGPGFVRGEVTGSGLAIAFGGVVLASMGLSKLTASLMQLAAAAIAWQQIGPLVRAAARPSKAAAPALSARKPAPAGQRRTVLEARNVGFAHGSRLSPVLSGCQLRIQDGDRLLLEGGSGAGKSTLAAVLSGIREPSQGLLLLGGLDRATLGAAEWRRRVAAAPQFHDNHVFTGSFAFNLMMGSRWPAECADLARAEALCRALGLGPLLDRMPAGLMQPVGETGWQLSHGERSRMFIARALLQESELVVLDESFGALDPESLSQTLSTVLERAPSLLVIAHP